MSFVIVGLLYTIGIVQFLRHTFWKNVESSIIILDNSQMERSETDMRSERS